jgi:Flp pilus assembly protein TadG
MPHYQSRKQRLKGQAILETALVLPILLMLSMLLVQFAIVMNASSTLTNLSREGARYAATQPALDAAIIARMQAVCPPSIKWANISSNIVITPAQGTSTRTTSGQLIKVQITYNMRNKAFLPTTFFGIPMFNTNYVTYTTMMIE